MKPEVLFGKMQCPKCSSELEVKPSETLTCQNDSCGLVFPIVGGVPIMINEDRSAFKSETFEQRDDTTFSTKRSSLVSSLAKLVPSLNNNVEAHSNFKIFAKELLVQNTAPKVLVIGCRNVGIGMESIVANPAIELINTDVSLNCNAVIVADCHDIPFQEGVFDGVIVQTVLEHVADPTRCVEEIHRVLKPGGAVYAETSFIQQIHMREYDFTRFTHMGHQRLFGGFEEIKSGMCSGPGMALGWAYQYFLLSFFKNQTARMGVKVFTRYTAFFLKYFDYLLRDNDAALDGAAVVYFMGKKRDNKISDDELVKQYRGGF